MYKCVDCDDDDNMQKIDVPVPSDNNTTDSHLMIKYKRLVLSSDMWSTSVNNLNRLENIIHPHTYTQVCKTARKLIAT